MNEEPYVYHHTGPLTRREKVNAGAWIVILLSLLYVVLIDKSHDTQVICGVIAGIAFGVLYINRNPPKKGVDN